MNLATLAQQVKSGELSLQAEAHKMLAFLSKQNDPKLLRECKAQAAAVLEYLSQRKDLSVAEHNAALKIKLGAEHRLGEVLAETVKHGGARKKQGNNALPCSNGTLPKEIGKMISSRAQMLARIPWEKIENQIEDKTEHNKKASQARIMKDLVKAPSRKYDVQDDIRRFLDLREKLAPNWTREEDKAALKQFFRQLANEV